MTRPAQARFLSLESLDARVAGERADVPAIQAHPKPDELTWWDWAVFLLHTVAEIEHALLVQYLYAAYSLSTNPTGPHLPANPAAVTDRWRKTIVKIAKEEMAHLLTEQNLLRFIGGPLNFEREDLPFRSKLYPFPLALEPLTKTSLAKYISAEMPAHPDAPEAEIKEIIKRATGPGDMPPNRVGVLFELLHEIFEDETKILDSDLRPQTLDLQASPADWHANAPPPEHLIVRIIKTRDDAKNALKDIGDQGEGSGIPSTDPDTKSHFERFLDIYRDFPETATEWVPTQSIPTNPTTATDVDPDPVAERNRITHPTTRLWAQLFNVRYRMLLTDLAHALLLPKTDEHGNPTPRDQLRDWAFNEMSVAVRGIARRLTREPAKATPAEGDPANAAAPFELPYTFAISDDEHDRWRLHGALFEASDALLAGLPRGDSLVAQIVSIDSGPREFVKNRLDPTATT